MKKQHMKKALVSALAFVMVFGLAACGGKSSNKSKHDADTISVCIASEPETMDPARNSTVDGGTMTLHLFSGLAKWDSDKDGKAVLKADLAEKLVDPVANEDGTYTYTYKIRKGAKWSDGKPVTAHDFVFAWNRAVSRELAADYSNMFQLIKGYDDIWPGEGKEPVAGAKLDVTAVDDNTLQVVVKNKVSYWNELLAFPTYLPVREDVVSDESWATSPEKYVSNGAYKLKEWKHNSLIVLEKNENYIDKKDITMKTIKFYLSDDTNNMLTNFKNGDWQMIDSMPSNEMDSLKKEYKDEYHVADQLGTYYMGWNINKRILPEDSTLTGVEAEKAQAEIRKAIGLMIDRNYIVNEIGKADQIPASSFVAKALKDSDGKSFASHAGNSKDYEGYYDVSSKAVKSNYKKAVDILKKYYKYDEKTGKFTNVPTLTYLYNTDDAHKAIGEYVQSTLANAGIKLQLENQEWATFLTTRKAGDFTIARNGWVADYNDPTTFLEMWQTHSGNNDMQFGKGEHQNLGMYDLDLTKFGKDVNVKNGTWAQTYDVLIDTIKTTPDDKARYQMMHMAEDMIMSTGCITPLYHYTDPYLLASDVEGFYKSPLGFSFFWHCKYK
ncbi:MAG: peptide ABC transporter substrate-binding protein [[Eubacterium] sulci]|nr:peptide ABC transporter substrate-binding protein [[Eubacterium] sulci]MBF1187296.1 peptide ABC transporter substrate-binding protein [[Eubacterium] sulci]